MATLSRRRRENVAGGFYVDDTCIDCDTCRWMAPETFDRAGEQSRVHAQPVTKDAVERALAALVACPTSSIGAESNGGVSNSAVSKRDVAAAARAFPREVARGVFHCGYHDEATFGAASWLLVRSQERGGNVLVDVPRWNDGLARRIEALGGIALVALTHQDDVGAHARWAERFGARRAIHARDVRAGTREVELVIEGDADVDLGGGLVAIPTPGHTRGSTCFLFEDRVLFSGDHLAFSRSRGHVYAFRTACWFDWEVQIASVEKLAARRFEHLLPGHGTPCSFAPDAMRAQIERCVEWMRSVR